MKVLTTAVAFLATAFAVPVLAATDGTLGPTSNGTFNVTANISAPQQDDVHVYGLEDIVHAGTTGETVATETVFFCIIRAPNAGNVGVTISSVAAGDTEYLLKSPGNTLPLIITLQYGLGDQYTQLNEGVESTFSAPSACNEVADDPTTARIDTTISGQPAVAGTYANTFLISIAPK